MSRRKPVIRAVGIPSSPLHPNSISYRLLEFVAERVADRLRKMQAADPISNTGDGCADAKFSHPSRHNR